MRILSRVFGVVLLQSILLHSAFAEGVVVGEPEIIKMKDEIRHFVPGELDALLAFINSCRLGASVVVSDVLYDAWQHQCEGDETIWEIKFARDGREIDHQISGFRQERELVGGTRVIIGSMVFRSSLSSLGLTANAGPTPAQLSKKREELYDYVVMINSRLELLMKMLRESKK